MDDIYQIEDIPLTKNRERSTKLSKTLAMLEVGQSFLVPEPLTADDLKKIRSNAYQWGQRKGVKISTRHFEGIGSLALEGWHEFRTNRITNRIIWTMSLVGIIGQSVLLMMM